MLTKQIQQIPRKSLKIFLIIVIPAIGIVAGCFLGLYLGNVTSAQPKLTWQPLGAPSNKPIKLLGLCDDEICVETKNGQRYHYNSTACDDRSAKLTCWQVDSTKVVEPIVPQFYDTCTISTEIPTPPIETIQLLGAKTCGSGSDKYTYYALLYDGSVWKWEEWINGADLIIRLFSAIIGSLIGFVGGIIIIIFVFIRRLPRMTDQTKI